MLPNVIYHQPSNDISWLIKQYEFIKYDANVNIIDKYVPREDVSIVFHFKNLPQINTIIKQYLPPFFIVPLSQKAQYISLHGQNDCMIITCKPTVLSRILNINLKPNNNIYINLPKQLFEPVWTELKHTKNNISRINIFNNFIKNIYPFKYIPDETDRNYDIFLQKAINTNLHEIVKELAISERTLQRRFSNRVGTTPKMLLRIIRINYLWDIITKEKTIDYHDLVFLGNYFDQTHLIKDFKSITGETPKVFFMRNLGIVNIYSGKQFI